MKFPIACDIKTCALLVHEFQYREVAVGLNGVADQRVSFPERFLDLIQVVDKGCRGLDIKRGSVCFGKFPYRNIFTKKLPRLVVEMIHESSPSSLGLAGPNPWKVAGSFLKPLLPKVELAFHFGRGC